MRHEFGEDEGFTAAIAHRQRLVAGFRKLREEIDAFQPDFLLIWGDDQYENFQEDIIPPFCVLAWDDIACQPLKRRRSNPWGEPAETVFRYAGCPKQGRLAGKLLEQGIDMAYAYKPLHEEDGLGHAFVNTLLFLDYERTGLPYPVLPFQVNCYGSKVIRNHGGSEEFSPEPDPPGPSPKRCMEVGAATARVLQDTVARGPDRFLELVPCVPDGKDLLAASRHGGRPGQVCGVPQRRLGRLETADDGADRSLRPAGDAQLVLSGWCHGGAGPDAGDCRLGGKLDQ